MQLCRVNVMLLVLTIVLIYVHTGKEMKSHVRPLKLRMNVNPIGTNWYICADRIRLERKCTA